jgi:hypothetical protein
VGITPFLLYLGVCFNSPDARLSTSFYLSTIFRDEPKKMVLIEFITTYQIEIIILIGIIAIIIYWWYKQWKKIINIINEIASRFNIHLIKSNIFSKKYSGLYQNQKFDINIKFDLALESHRRLIKKFTSISLFLKKESPFIIHIRNAIFFDRFLKEEDETKWFKLVHLNDKELDSKISIFTTYEDTAIIKEIFDTNLRNLLSNFRQDGEIKVDEDRIYFEENDFIKKENLINIIEIIVSIATNIEKLQYRYQK